VENPREIIQPGDEVKVKILEIDSERRRLSLSIKRVEGQILPLRQIEPEAGAEGETSYEDVPELGLSEDVFAGETAAPADEPVAEAEPESEASAPAEVADEAPAVAEPAVEEPTAPAEEPAAEVAESAEPVAEAEPESEASAPAEVADEAPAADEDPTPQA
jgi:small subunit ribosomal protein S1